MEKDPNIDTLNGFLESEQNLSITSTGSIVPASINKSPLPSKFKSSKKKKIHRRNIHEPKWEKCLERKSQEKLQLRNKA